MPYETDVNFVVTCAFGLWADFNWPLRIQDGRCVGGAGYSGVVMVGLRNPNDVDESRMADAVTALGILASSLANCQTRRNLSSPDSIPNRTSPAVLNS